MYFLLLFVFGGRGLSRPNLLFKTGCARNKSLVTVPKYGHWKWQFWKQTMADLVVRNMKERPTFLLCPESYFALDYMKLNGLQFSECPVRWWAAAPSLLVTWSFGDWFLWLKEVVLSLSWGRKSSIDACWGCWICSIWGSSSNTLLTERLHRFY